MDPIKPESVPDPTMNMKGIWIMRYLIVNIDYYVLEAGTGFKEPFDKDLDPALDHVTCEYKHGNTKRVAHMCRK